MDEPYISSDDEEETDEEEINESEIIKTEIMPLTNLEFFNLASKIVPEEFEDNDPTVLHASFASWFLFFGIVVIAC